MAVVSGTTKSPPHRRYLNFSSALIHTVLIEHGVCLRAYWWMAYTADIVTGKLALVCRVTVHLADGLAKDTLEVHFCLHEWF